MNNRTFTYRKSVFAAMLAVLLIAMGVLTACGDNESTGGSDHQNNDNSSKALLDEYFDIVIDADYDRLMEILPPDIVCDDVIIGHISEEEYTADLHESIFNELGEEFIYGKEDAVEQYGSNLRVEYKITDIETATQKEIKEISEQDCSGPAYYNSFFGYYASEYYSPIFSQQGIQGIEQISGVIKLCGDMGESSEEEFEACFIKHSGEWYFVGMECDLSYCWMWL